MSKAQRLPGLAASAPWWSTHAHHVDDGGDDDGGDNHVDDDHDHGGGNHFKDYHEHGGGNDNSVQDGGYSQPRTTPFRLVMIKILILLMILTLLKTVPRSPLVIIRIECLARARSSDPIIP